MLNNLNYSIRLAPKSTAPTPTTPADNNPPPDHGLTLMDRGSTDSFTSQTTYTSAPAPEPKSPPVAKEAQRLPEPTWETRQRIWEKREIELGSPQEIKKLGVKPSPEPKPAAAPKDPEPIAEPKSPPVAKELAPIGESEPATAPKDPEPIAEPTGMTGSSVWQDPPDDPVWRGKVFDSANTNNDSSLKLDEVEAAIGKTTDPQTLSFLKQMESALDFQQKNNDKKGIPWEATVRRSDAERGTLYGQKRVM